MKIECEVSATMAREIEPHPERIITENIRVTLEGSCDAILTLLRDAGVNLDLVRKLRVT